MVLTASQSLVAFAAVVVRTLHHHGTAFDTVYVEESRSAPTNSATDRPGDTIQIRYGSKPISGRHWLANTSQAQAISNGFESPSTISATYEVNDRRNGTILATCAISTAVGCGKCRLPSMIVTERITLTAELDALTEYWPQRVVAEVNGNLFKVAKAVGSTRWHSHDDQDERTAAHASPVRQEHEIPLL